jgi:N-dimethylarginine dimethylaminohydrolase
MSVILCDPDNLQTTVITNPLSTGEPINKEKAMNQFRAYIRSLKGSGIEVFRSSSEELNSVRKSYDLTYCANWGAFIPLPEIRPMFVLSRMAAYHRRTEAALIKPFLENLGIEVIEMPASQFAIFEGQADVQISHGGQHVWITYGIRTNQEGARAFAGLVRFIAKKTNKKCPTFHFLKMVKPEYYHSDLCLFVDGDRCLVRPTAFSTHSVRELERVFDKGFHIFDNDEEPLALNMYKNKQHLFVRPISEKTRQLFARVLKCKYIHQINVSEIEKGGGSLLCLTLILN